MDELTIGTRVDHERYGEGSVTAIDGEGFTVNFDRAGEMEFSSFSDAFQITGEEEAAEEESWTASELEEILTEVLDRYAGLQEIIPLGGKWEGGTVLLQPEDKTMKPQEIPMEKFFHKIVMVRDRLRVLEQHINSHPKLTDEEKVDLQQYITRIYGSLTSFNSLFKRKDDHFKGTGGS